MKWKITRDEYLSRLGLNAKEFDSMLYAPRPDDLRSVVPLRNIARIDSLLPMRREMLVFLLRRVRTLDGGLPFANVDARMFKMDPRNLLIGQRFVYREVYQRMVENVPDFFKEFLITGNGLADLGASFVFGESTDGEYSMSCYIPPIIEQHGEIKIVMDGVHRNYVAMQTGKTPNAILVTGVELPFPCVPTTWDSARVISLAEKPEKTEDRFFELNKGLFRDLKHMGIDG